MFMSQDKETQKLGESLLEDKINGIFYCTSSVNKDNVWNPLNRAWEKSKIKRFGFLFKMEEYTWWDNFVPIIKQWGLEHPTHEISIKKSNQIITLSINYIKKIN